MELPRAGQKIVLPFLQDGNLIPRVTRLRPQAHSLIILPMNLSSLNMDARRLTERIRLNHAYATPSLSRRPLWPTWRYYAGFLQIVIGAWQDLQNGIFSREDFHKRAVQTLKLVERVGGHVEATGLDRLGILNTSAVLVSNHMSLLETFLIPCFVLPFRPLAVVIKRELLRYPFFGPVLRGLPHIAVSRENPKADYRAVMEQGLQLLQKGHHLLIFPQSTRQIAFSPAEFNSLGAKLAGRAAVPLIPLALQTDLHGIGRWLKDFGPIRPERPVRLAFGPPLEPGPDLRTLHEQSIRFIAKRLMEWHVPVHTLPSLTP